MDTLSYLLNCDKSTSQYEIKGTLRDVAVRVYVDRQHQQPIIALSAKCHGNDVQGVHPVAWKNRITERMQIVAKDILYEIQRWYVSNESNSRSNFDNALPYWRKENKEYDEVLPSNYLVSARIVSIDWNGDISRFWTNADKNDKNDEYNQADDDARVRSVDGVHNSQVCNAFTQLCDSWNSNHDTVYELYDGLYDPHKHGDVHLEAMCSVECKRMPAPWNDEPCNNIKPKLEDIPRYLNCCTFFSATNDAKIVDEDHLFCIDAAYFSKINVARRLAV